MNNTQLHPSIGTPAAGVTPAWLSKRLNNDRFQDKAKKSANALRDEMLTLSREADARKIAFRPKAYSGLIMPHERFVTVATRQSI